MSAFSEFKQSFYGRVNDFTLFDCGDINILKVVLDGLKVNYVDKGKVRAFLFYPLWLYNIYCWFNKQKRKKKIFDYSQFNGRSFLISDIGRHVQSSDHHNLSFYFKRITESLGRQNCLVILENKSAISDFDISFPGEELIHTYDKLTSTEKKLRKDLIKTYFRIKKSDKFSKAELENIKFAIHKFFHQYKAWNKILVNFTNLKKCYFVCHYHKEGQILALKNRKIECIELQHGLISSKDIFYLFPKSISNISDKMLFADFIFVYGEYWKYLLSSGGEYSAKQVKIIGYYQFEDNSNVKNKELENTIAGKHVILVTTQTFLHNYFIDFVETLEKNIIKNKRNYIILLKPHPAEKISVYNNAFQHSQIIKVVQFPLPLLFYYSSKHISIYSTTLYDATRFNLINYVFRVDEYSDYVDEILKSKVATEIRNMNDVFQESSVQGNADPGLFYSAFNKEILKIDE